MARFVFKLQPLLNVKKQQEDQLKNELGKAMQRLEKEKAILKGIVREEEKCIKELNSKSCSPITVQKLREYNEYISLLRERKNIQKENVNLAEDNVDKVREELIKQVQEREILDKLKERKYGEFLDERLKEEQLVNDEVVSFKHNSLLNGEKNGER